MSRDFIMICRPNNIFGKSVITIIFILLLLLLPFLIFTRLFYLITFLNDLEKKIRTARSFLAILKSSILFWFSFRLILLWYIGGMIFLEKYNNNNLHPSSSSTSISYIYEAIIFNYISERPRKKNSNRSFLSCVLEIFYLVLIFMSRDFIMICRPNNIFGKSVITIILILLLLPLPFLIFTRLFYLITFLNDLEKKIRTARSFLVFLKSSILFWFSCRVILLWYIDRIIFLEKYNNDNLYPSSSSTSISYIYEAILFNYIFERSRKKNLSGSFLSCVLEIVPHCCASALLCV